MQGSKGLLASRTFWGAMVTLLSGVAGLFGETIAPAEADAIVTGGSALGLAIGAVLTIWGRMKASKAIGVAALLLAAGGLQACSLAPGGSQVEAAVASAVEEGISERKAYNDRKAATLLTLPCDISVGAYYRLENAVQQEALTMLCSGKKPGEAPPPLETTGTL